MLIAEELLLLTLDDTSGKLLVPRQTVEVALGGALLAELALAERVSLTPKSAGWTKRGRMHVISEVPTDDAELDRVLQAVVAHEGIPAKQLITPMSGKRVTKGLVDRLLHRLASRGVLTEQRGTVLKVFPTQRWPSADPAPEREVRERLHAALVDRLTPTERTVTLIALLKAIGQLGRIVRTDDRRALRARAKELAEGDWAAAAVKAVIDELAAMASSAAVAAGAAGAAGG